MGSPLVLEDRNETEKKNIPFSGATALDLGEPLVGIERDANRPIDVGGETWHARTLSRAHQRL